MALLNGVGEFVSQKPLATFGAGRVLRRREDDVAARRISQRIDCACRVGGTAPVVNSHFAEVVAKTRFEEPSCGSVQRAPAVAQGSDLRFQFRRDFWRTPTSIVCLAMQLFLALGAEPLHKWCL
jgi:hypothetical protein